MNKLQENVFEMMVDMRVRSFLSDGLWDLDLLYNVLNCTDDTFSVAIMSVLADGKINVPSQELDCYDVDDLLAYAKVHGLGLDCGFESIIESYIINQLSMVLGMDLLEWL